jgi:hypothetical protein
VWVSSLSTLFTRPEAALTMKMPRAVSLTAWRVRTNARTGGESSVRAGVARGWLRVRANPSLARCCAVALRLCSRLRRHAHISTATPPHLHIQPAFTAPHARAHPHTCVRFGGGHQQQTPLTGLRACTCAHDVYCAQLLGYADETLQVAAGVAVGRPGVHVPTGFPAAADAALTQDASALILSLAEQHRVRVLSAACNPRAFSARHASVSSLNRSAQWTHAMRARNTPGH